MDYSDEGQDDPCRDYTALAKPPNHNWTLEHRVMLCLLRQKYQMSWSSTRLIFCRLFENELSTPFGPTKEALNSMYFASEERFNLSGSWDTLKDAIEKIAEELSIPFSKKEAHELRAIDRESLLVDRHPDVEVDSDSTLLGDDILEVRSPINTPSKRSGRQKAIPRIGFRA